MPSPDSHIWRQHMAQPTYHYEMPEQTGNTKWWQTRIGWLSRKATPKCRCLRGADGPGACYTHRHQHRHRQKYMYVHVSLPGCCLSKLYARFFYCFLNAEVQRMRSVKVCVFSKFDANSPPCCCWCCAQFKRHIINASYSRLASPHYTVVNGAYYSYAA